MMIALLVAGALVFPAPVGSVVDTTLQACPGSGGGTIEVYVDRYADGLVLAGQYVGADETREKGYPRVAAEIGNDNTVIVREFHTGAQGPYETVHHQPHTDNVCDFFPSRLVGG